MSGVGHLINRLLGREKTVGKATITLEDAKELARHEDPKVRSELAKRKDLKPELLYFLAEDPTPEVRQAIAMNAAAPRQADLLLAKDKDPVVRERLAEKIATLAPGLTADEQDRLRRLTYEALEVLARDQMVRVRQILSETLKDVAHAPPDVIRRLARDVELVVSGPVLEFSPVLTDGDLLEIIGSSPIQGALGAISRRSGVSSRVADAVVATDDIEAIADLLANPSAQIREETLDHIVDRAPDVELWHAPLVKRPKLPAKAARRLARFVAENLLEVLQKREDLDQDTVDAVKAEVRRRVDEEVNARTQTKGDKPEPTAETAGLEPPDAMHMAKKMHADNHLSEKVILDALVNADDRDFVIAALCVKADLSESFVRKVLATQSAKGVMALVWKAGMSPKTGEQIQLKLAKVSYGSLLKAKGGGEEFPLSEDDMIWQLELFGDLKAERLR